MKTFEESLREFRRNTFFAAVQGFCASGMASQHGEEAVVLCALTVAKEAAKNCFELVE